MKDDPVKDETQTQQWVSKQQKLGLVMLTSFLVVCGFLVGFPRGYFGEQGSMHAGLVLAGKVTFSYFVILLVTFLTATICNRLKVSEHLRNVAVIVLAMGGIWAAQTVVDGRTEDFFNEFGSGAGLGLLIGAGSYWAQKKGWTRRRTRPNH